MYVIDTSSLIDLNRYYRRQTFGSVWTRVEGLIEAGQLIAPREVYVELTEGDDALVPWAKGLTNFFVDPDDAQGLVVADIHTRFPEFITLLKPTDADPWCVALALVKSQASGNNGWTVINQESVRHKHRMPAVCHGFSLTSMRLLDFFDVLGGF